MKHIYTIFIAFWLLSGIAKGQSWTSSNRTVSDDDVAVTKTVIDTDGNIISLGYFKGSVTFSSGESLNSEGARDYYLAKYDDAGSLIWLRGIGGTLNEFSQGGVDVDDQGNIFATGGFQGVLRYSDTDSLVSSGSHDIFLMKYNSAGDILWARNAGAGGKRVYSSTLGVDESGDIVLTGVFFDSIQIYNDITFYSENLADYFYAKFEPVNGDIVWAKQIKSLNDNINSFLGNYVNGNSYLLTGIYKDSIQIGDDTLSTLTSEIDVHLMNTDLDGNLSWIRSISGSGREFSHDVIRDNEGNIYVIGFYYSDTLIVQSDDTNTETFIGQEGICDIFIIKYLTDGSLEWVRTTGGKGQDQIFDIEYFDEKLHVSGFFSDTLNWGGIPLATAGTDDEDMLVGSILKDGVFSEANSYHGRNKSKDEARGIVQTQGQIYTIMRSNSDLLELGDSSYISTNGKFYIVLGVVGCQTISIDNIDYADVANCYGDSTGWIQISASGGFGPPWGYRIKEGEIYQSLPFFPALPAGDYQVSVIDGANCIQTGEQVTIIQPDSLQIIVENLVDTINAINGIVEEEGLIVTSSEGGSGGNTYTLHPIGIDQGIGTFSFPDSSSAGLYTVEVTDKFECEPAVTDTFEIVYKNTIIIDNIFGRSLVDANIYPNPSSSLVNVEMQLDADEVMLEVVSLTGQIVMRKEAYTSGGELRETLDVSDLAKGMYMLRVNNETLKSSIVVH